jgi:hypothetical protein
VTGDQGVETVVRPRGRRVALRLALVVCAVAVAVVVVAGPAPAGAAPLARVADVSYGPLAAVGVSAHGATISGRDLRVHIRLRRSAGIRLSVVTGDEIRGYAKRSLVPGSYLLHGVLDRTPRGSGLMLRITARLAGGRRGRGRFKLTTLAANHAPSALALSSAAVAENQPAGTSVGTFSATDADRSDVPAFALVSGPGGQDDAAFTIAGPTLRTAASFDFEARSSYSIRVRVTDGHGGSFERTFTIGVTNVNEPPVGLGLSGGHIAENQPAGTPVGTLTATDPDAGDAVAFALVGGPGSADNASFTLSGATVRTAGPFDFETKSSYAVRVAASDGKGGTTEAAFVIAVTNVNEAPRVVASAGPVAYLENDPATAIDPGLSVSDVDSPTLAAATVAVTAGLQPGADTLSFTAAAGISGAYAPATGLLTLTGTATPAAYEAALRSVRFLSTSDAPGTARTVSFAASDGTLDSPPATRAIAVTPVNDPPTVTASAGPVTFTEAGPATPIDPGLALADPDSRIAGATVQITGHHAGPEDVLALPAQPNITGAYDSTTGTLTLSGTDTVAAYQAALRAVTYDDTSANPSTAPRTVTVLATDDSASSSAPATRGIAITATDTPPTVSTASGALAYTENDPAAAIDPAVTVSDPDSVDLTGATVQITGGYAAGQDVLALPAQPLVSGSFDPASGVLTLSGPAPVAAYQTALAAVTYADTSENPSPAPRIVSFLARDATGFGAPATRGIAVAPVDDPPVAVADAATVTEDSAATAIDVLANDTDVDGGAKAVGATSPPAHGTVVVTGGGTGLTYAPEANYCGADSFLYKLNGGSMATVSVTVSCVDDPPVAVDDAATVTEDAGVVAIDVLANDTDIDGGPKTVAAASTPAHGSVLVTGGATGLTYAPDANYCGVDSFTYTLNGGSAATVSVTVTCVDDPPVAVDDAATVTEDAGASPIAVLANDTDVDGGPRSIQAVTQPANGAVAVTGGGTGLTYAPSPNYCNTEPGGAPDVFTYTLNGGSTAAVAMAVTCVPDPPVVVVSAAQLAYTENDPATPVDPAVTVTDPDPGAQVVGATAQITGHYAGAEDVLALGGSHPGIAASFSGDTLTLSGAASPAAYQAALADVTYRNGSDNPSTETRKVTFTVTDETALTGAGTRVISVTAVDDPPVAVADAATVIEDSGASPIVVLANDTDVDGWPRSIQSVTQPAHGAVAITGAGTGLTYAPSPNYCNNPPGTAPDTFTYALNGGSTASVAVTVTCVNDDPVAANDTIPVSAVGNTALVVNVPGHAPPAVDGPHRSVAADILANDTDVDGPGPLAVVAGTFTTHDGGTVVMQSDGGFVYTPKPGCADAADFFAYTVTDGYPGTPGTAVGRVDLTLSGCVWYVDNNAAGNAGTSTAPFDTLAQAQAASGAGDSIFVARGDGTSSGYGAGIDLKANQQLIGEAADLKVGGTILQAGDPTRRPTIAANNADVVTLASGDTVRGLRIDPAGTGGGIAGGAGVAGGTIDDVRIVDTGTAGTQPGVELNGTTGSFAITGLTIDNTGAPSAATGILLNNNAGTVDFGTTSVTTAGGRAIDASGTNMSTSTFDSVTTTGSGTGGVSMVNTTGSTTFSALDLTTTSGATAAFHLSNAGSVTVSSAGPANVSATGGPAIDVSATPGPSLSFDSVSSAGSSGDAINLNGLGTGTFSATAGALSGFAGTAFDLAGGSGAVLYAGSIGNGSGLTAHVTGRTGATDTISGQVSDGSGAGGGILLAGNTGGATVFSGAADTINTGSGDAVVMGTSDGHALSFTGGGLSVTTTSGKGLAATGSGTLVVSGAGNTIDTATGVALNVSNTDIGAAGVTFQHVSSNGASDGIVLVNTGASGNLAITGNGGACTAAVQTGCSGGQIQHTAGADDSSASPVGTGIVLDNTLTPSLTRVWLHDNSNYAIRGTSVSGLTLANSVINGANGNNGTTPFDDSSVWFDNLTGSASVTNTSVSGGFEDNFRVVNTSGSLNRITFTSDTIGDNSAAGVNDGILLSSTTTAGQLEGTVQSSTFTGAGGDLLQYDHNGSGAGDLVLTGNAFSNNHPGIATGGGGLTLTNGGTSGATTMSITGGNTFRDAVGNALTIAKSTGTSTQTGTFTGNTIGVNGVANSGSAEGDALKLQTLGQGSSTWTVANNTIRGYNNFGVELLAGGSASAQGGAVNATITGNTIDQPGSTAGTLSLPKNGVHLNIGTVPGDTYQACAVIGGPGSLANSLASAGKPGDDGLGNLSGGEDVRLRQRQSATIRLPGYSGAPTDGAAVQAFVAANNPTGGPTVATSINSPPGGGFTGTGTTCP